MTDIDNTVASSGETYGADDYPLRDTAAALNDKLGLYLSEEQQRGLAVGLLVGVALGAALLSWSLGSAIRRSS